MEPIKLCVIGSGAMAKKAHLPSLIYLKDRCRVLALCDIAEAKARSMAEQFGIGSVYTNYREMMTAEKPDAVYVLLEPDRVCRVVLDCLDMGVHVFTEKPAGISTYQAEAMERCARKNNRTLAVGQNRRYIPLVRHVIERMREATEITQVNSTYIKNVDIAESWFHTSAFYGDIVHAVDLVRYIAGSEPAQAASVISKFNSPVDNAWSSVFRFENGVVGMLQAHYRTGGRVHSFEIHGQGASAFINLGFGDTACEATILNNGAAERLNGIKIAGSSEFWQYYGFKQEAEDFISSIQEGREPLCTIKDAAGTMRMLDMLLRNAI